MRSVLLLIAVSFFVEGQVFGHAPQPVQDPERRREFRFLGSYSNSVGCSEHTLSVPEGTRPTRLRDDHDRIGEVVFSLDRCPAIEYCGSCTWIHSLLDGNLDWFVINKTYFVYPPSTAMQNSIRNYCVEHYGIWADLE